MILLIVVLAAAAAAYWYWLRAPAPAAPRLAAPIVVRRLEHGGRARTCVVFRPPRAPAGAPLVLVLHASGGDARSIRRQTAYAFDRLAEEHGFVVAYPEGVDGHWNDCRRAGRTAAKRLAVDDVGFVRTIVGALRRDLAVGPVFAAGYSNGGHMCFRLALEAPDLVRAIAVFAANLPTAENSECAPPRRFVPAIVINGTRDRINPYSGGRVKVLPWDDRGTVCGAEQTLRILASPLSERAVRTPRTVVVPADGRPTFVERESIGADAGDVALFTVQGGGHVIPQPGYRFFRIVGATERRFDAPAASWELFARVLRASE